MLNVLQTQLNAFQSEIVFFKFLRLVLVDSLKIVVFKWPEENLVNWASYLICEIIAFALAFFFCS